MHIREYTMSHAVQSNSEFRSVHKLFELNTIILYSLNENSRNQRKSLRCRQFRVNKV